MLIHLLFISVYIRICKARACLIDTFYFSAVCSIESATSIWPCQHGIIAVPSKYGIFPYIYHKIQQPNVSKCIGKYINSCVVGDIPLVVIANWVIICYRSHLLREPETAIEYIYIYYGWYMGYMLCCADSLPRAHLRSWAQHGSLRWAK